MEFDPEVFPQGIFIERAGGRLVAAVQAGGSEK
jgi:hypothetical protein